MHRFGEEIARKWKGEKGGGKCGSIQALVFVEVSLRGNHFMVPFKSARKWRRESQRGGRKVARVNGKGRGRMEKMRRRKRGVK